MHPTESMTRALISDDSIARQVNAGPVQLGYVSIDFIIYTHLHIGCLQNITMIKSNVDYKKLKIAYIKGIYVLL